MNFSFTADTKPKRTLVAYIFLLSLEIFSIFIYCLDTVKSANFAIAARDWHEAKLLTGLLCMSTPFPCVSPCRPCSVLCCSVSFAVVPVINQVHVCLSLTVCDRRVRNTYGLFSYWSRNISPPSIPTILRVALQLGITAQLSLYSSAGILLAGETCTAYGRYQTQEAVRHPFSSWTACIMTGKG